MEGFLSKIVLLLPAIIVIAIVVLALLGFNWFMLGRKRELGEGNRVTKRLIMVLLSLVGIIIILLALPVSDTTRGQLLGFLGLLFSAIIALSSTTFVSNAMAGLMLRNVNSFRSGDFIRVNTQFGRVTERGLFHTEIQTENRNLVTIPNLFLITNPVNVVRSSGTIVSATVSLGYDVPHQLIKEQLKKAALDTKLEEPFFQILELGDFSVTYRIAGFLKEVNKLLTARSTLRQMMLDNLHAADIEIVSPTFMNQRQMKIDAFAIPPKKRGRKKDIVSDEQDPEEIIFDKADEAQKIEELQFQHDNLNKEIVELESSKKELPEEKFASIQKTIDTKSKKVDSLKSKIDISIKNAKIG